MRHELKIGVDFANAVLCGEKTFELRKNDRGYQKGDAVVFRVLDRDGTELPEHPGTARCANTAGRGSKMRTSSRWSSTPTGK